MKQDLTAGNVTSSMLRFALPMILGNLLQQCYNIADTLIVGQFVGADALAAAGSAYTLMTFLNSVLIGLCMGSGALFSFYHGKGDQIALHCRVQTAFVLIGAVSLALTALVTLLLDPILHLLQTPASLYALLRGYTALVLLGIPFIFLYNYFAFLLRAVGNSVAPLWFLGGASMLNIGLDLLFVLPLGLGLEGAAAATVIAQGVSGIGLGAYTWLREPAFRFSPAAFRREEKPIKELGSYCAMTCAQQSVMNFGILMVQGRVNTFGPAVMAAFAAGVKIDTFAYMPAQEFGNAYSLFLSQNYGAGRHDRVKVGTKRAFEVSAVFCACISLLVWVLARQLMRIFVQPSQLEIIRIGMEYLRLEGSFYVGIGVLFLLYGYFRGLNRPEISLLLTAVSLGTRVALAYALSALPAVGVTGIWLSIPIGWALADILGLWLMKMRMSTPSPGR